MSQSVGAMSTSLAEPTWPTGERPEALDFPVEAPHRVCEAISRVLERSFPPAAEKGARYHTQGAGDGPVGRYRLTTRDGAWFVRVTARPGNPGLEKSISDHLDADGVAVNPLVVAGASLECAGRTLRIDVRPFVSGHHFSGSTEELRSLSTTLAACHESLARFPLADKVRASAIDRNRRLVAARGLVRDAVASGRFALFGERESWAMRHRDWLATMAEGFDPDMHLWAGSQCVHAEVHPGNVMFEDRAAVLVDFEESVHFFVPPEWDLAFLVQRFCLADSPSAFVARERLAVVARAYGRPLLGLADMMLQAAWFKVPTMIDLRRARGIVTPISEWNKFITLERQVAEYAGVI